VLLRLAYLGVTSAPTMLGPLPMSDRAKDVEILAPRHQITVLQRQLHGEKVQFTPADRALLAALLHRLAGDVACSLSGVGNSRLFCAAVITTAASLLGALARPGPSTVRGAGIDAASRLNKHDPGPLIPARHGAR
jgi:hypothetical protein